MNPEEALQQRLAVARRAALKVGLAGAGLCLVGAFVSPDRLLHSYLVGWLLWLGVSLGSLAFAMLHGLTGGAWGKLSVRQMLAAARVLPLMALMFVPIMLAMSRLYPWARAGAAADSIIATKSAYLNPTFFVIRALVYFGVWTWLAWTLDRWSAVEDRGARPAMRRRAMGLSCAGLILYVLTMTFAAIDWGMSLEPHHFSVTYGLVIILGQALSALSFAAAFLWLAVGCESVTRTLAADDLNDVGNLMLAFVMLWSYVSFAEFLIVWSGNLPDDAVWFIRRSAHGWLAVAVLLALGHFAVPFLILLSRRVKRSCRALGIVAVLLLAGRLLDLFWRVMPAHATHASLNPLDLVAPVAIGGLWFAAFARALAARRFLPDAPRSGEERADGHR